MAPARKKQDKPQPQQHQGAPEQPPQQPQQPPHIPGIKDRKLQVIAAIQKRCADPVWIDRLRKIAHGDDSKIMRAVNSYSTFIANDQGAGRDENKKYICEASLSSLFSVFLEAFQLGLDIGGGRDLVAVIVYNNTAELEVTYKGFVNALTRHFDNPFVQFGNIFEGDVFIPKISDNKATFIHEPKDPLSQDWQKLKGAYCYFTYTNRENKQEVSRIVWIDKAGIEMIRSKARSQKVWNEFWGEMVLKAIIRRASKVPFASIDFDEGEIDPGTVDNKHYMLEDKSGDRLALLMKRQHEILDDDKAPAEGKEKPAEGTGAVEGEKASPDAAQGQQEASKPEEAKPVDDAVRFTDNGHGEGQVIDNGTVPAAELTDDDFEEEGK